MADKEKNCWLNRNLAGETCGIGQSPNGIPDGVPDEDQHYMDKADPTKSDQAIKDHIAKIAEASA